MCNGGVGGWGGGRCRGGAFLVAEATMGMHSVRAKGRREFSFFASSSTLMQSDVSHNKQIRGKMYFDVVNHCTYKESRRLILTEK